MNDCSHGFRCSHLHCPEAATRGVSRKFEPLENFANFTAKHLCWGLFLKRYSTQVLSSEICEIFKSTYFEEHL